MEVPTDAEVRAEITRRKRAKRAKERAAKQKEEFNRVRSQMIWERTPCWLQVLQTVGVLCGVVAVSVGALVFVEYMRYF
jgi:hypothetical protein